MNNTYTPEVSKIEKKWYIIDASEKSLGRVATEAARLLRGKHKPNFMFNIDTGDSVIIINTDKAVLTGDKLNQKMYRHHSEYLGGLKQISAKEMMSKNSDKAMFMAVKGMLPHTKLGRAQIKKLRVYKDEKHNQTAQKPEVLDVK